ncbi:LOW QUALITY PROTEIN: uncharacterized protein LOC121239366 [Juglans microcarpa x Juglans regia]|uniref:LOW QUALITY PROTEIN: uncharacterized protein LOC121239366 n=1 Tax=Juglans microcarpa x Juglans regia TaxID=2249226 RepID=UPI001B7F74C8|nr:LOW QUALITY PROTEIN: uncharacterized protein LOC121239366 [Juglans microcarpa x Juglans regia]
MGRHLERTNSGVQFEGSHPGCVWGILHILDYHHWHNAKKMRQHKKHGGLGRHASCKTNEQATLKKRDNGVQEFMDSEGERMLVEQHDTESSPAKTNRRSGKAHIKESIARDMPKQSHRYWNLSYAARTWFWRIIPIHHLEHADNYLGEMHTVGANPIIPLKKVPTLLLLPDCRLLFVTPEEQDIGHKKFGVWDTMNDVNYLRHNQSVGKHAVFPKICDEGSDDFVHHNLGESNQLNIEVPNNQFKECSDVLEIFKIHKESFLKILQDTNVGMKHFQSLQNSKHKARLTKSGSFPLANSSSKKYISTRTLEHKQNESWSFPKGEKMLSSSLVSESDSSVSQRSMPSMADNNTVGGAMRQETNSSSPDSSQGLIHRGWNQQVINHFKEIKQKIWHALKENRKESNPTSMEPLIEREPFGKEISGTSKISMSQGGIDNPGSFHEGNGSNYDPSRGRLGYIQRTSSLNESLDRYTELFERTFGQGAKWHHSKSLKLTDEGKVPSSGFASKSFKRRLSLPDLDYFCSSLNDPSRDSLSSVMPIRTAGDCCTIVEKNNHCEPKSFSTLVEEQTPEPIHAALETEFQKDMINGNDSGWNVLSSADLTEERNHEGNAKTGNLSDLTVGKGSLQPDQIFGLTMNHSRELVGFSTKLVEPDPVSDLQTRFPDDLNNLAEFPIYEGPASSPMDIQMDDPDASVDQQIMSNTYSLPVVCSIVTPETTEETNMNTEDQILHFKLGESDEADFNYVRVVLELSGFIKNENLGTWHSLDQPLSPLLFKELEAFLHPELEDYEEDVDGSCDHQILFYLINNTLLEIYERSFTYFPRAFTFNRHIRPMPRGHHLLEEVWAKISSYLSLRPELDQSLEDVLARDLAKGDGWMNLQFDNECVALELEDLILEELLNELVCS